MHRPATWEQIEAALPPDVTRAEVEAWLVLVPRMDPTEPRAPWYVRAWSVPGKIQAARAGGWLPAGFAEEVARRTWMHRRPPPALTILFE